MGTETSGRGPIEPLAYFLLDIPETKQPVKREEDFFTMSDTDNVALPLVLSLKEDVVLLEQPDGSVRLESPQVRMAVTQPSSGLLAALHALASSDGATAEQLVDLVTRCDGVASLPIFLAYLRHFIQGGMICHTVRWPGGKLATLMPTSSTYQWRSDEPDVNTRYVISRFAYLRRHGEQFIFTSPLAPAIVMLHDWRAIALLHTLARPCGAEELCRVVEDIPDTSVVMFVRLLLGCHILSSVGDDGRPKEETSTLTQWDFHDLLFHVSSRLGKQHTPYGATFRFLGKIDPLPAVKPPMSADAISLYRPNLQALKDNDLPFTRVLEERRSIRIYNEQPITAVQLGEFLFRTARIRSLAVTAQAEYERSDRPYPSAGACYELELYVVVNACEGLSSGLYHYDPQEHQIHRLADRTREAETLLGEADSAAGQQGRPQVLLILAARFQRVAWKYEAMAYAAILKDVGVLYQTMYLVATAMGLAGCALGGGNSDLFAVAAGTDYYVETSVGEFMLGRKMES